MDTGAKKRKRSLVKDFCVNCGKDNGNGYGHLVQYCGFPGGKFYKPEDPLAGRKIACKQKFNDEAKAKSESKKMGQITMMATADAKDRQIEDLQRTVEELQGQFQSMSKAIKGIDEKLAKFRVIKGKGKGNGKGQQQSQSQSQTPSQSQRQVQHAQPSYHYPHSQPWDY
jgi:hypothetical protein